MNFLRCEWILFAVAVFFGCTSARTIAEKEQNADSISCFGVADSISLEDMKKPAFRLCHYAETYLAPEVAGDDGVFAVYSYPWVPEIDTPKLINSRASRWFAKIKGQLYNVYTKIPFRKPPKIDASRYQMLELVPSAHVNYMNLDLTDIPGNTVQLLRYIPTKYFNAKAIWDSITAHIIAAHSKAVPGTYTIVSGRLQPSDDFQYNIFYKVIWDRQNPKNSYAMSFSSKEWRQEGSCARYGYTQHSRFVSCTKAQDFIQYIGEVSHSLIKF